MNRYLQFTILFIVAFIMFFVFFDDPDIASNDHRNEVATFEDTATASEDANITYSATEKPSKTVASSEETAKKPKREKYVESKALSAYGVYEVSLINTAQDLSKKYNKIVMLQGKIDESAFLLKIPDYLVESDTDKIKLRIKKISTGDEKFISIPFLPQMGDTSQQISMQIDFSDPENYSYKEQPVIVPIPN